MKILFLSQRVPYPPDRGDRITTYHFLRHFAARGATLRVGCLAEDERDVDNAAELQGRVPAVTAVCAPRIAPRRRKVWSLRALPMGRSVSLTYFRVPQLMAQVDRWYAEDPPDLVYMYSAYMALYVVHRDSAARLMQFAELDSDKFRQFAAHRRGAGHRLLGRWIYGREARLLLEFERHVARTFDASLVVSEVEKQLFQQHIPDVEPTVVPNGVDVEHFASRGDARREPHTVVFTGVMDYEPNVDGVTWFVRACWPRIRARFADARFLIVGARPAPAVRALGDAPGVEVTGRVPETPPFFDRAAVAVAPLRLARGVQNKVLEALSMGLPLVGSPQAVQGLGNVPDRVLSTAEGADATVERIAALFDDPAAARAMGARAAAWVRAHYRWENMYARMDRVVDACLAPRAARAADATASS